MLLISQTTPLIPYLNHLSLLFDFSSLCGWFVCFPFWLFFFPARFSSVSLYPSPLPSPLTPHTRGFVKWPKPLKVLLWAPTRNSIVYLRSFHLQVCTVYVHWRVLHKILSTPSKYGLHNYIPVYIDDKALWINWWCSWTLRVETFARLCTLSASANLCKLGKIQLNSVGWMVVMQIIKWPVFIFSTDTEWQKFLLLIKSCLDLFTTQRK